MFKLRKLITILFFASAPFFLMGQDCPFFDDDNGFFDDDNGFFDDDNDFFDNDDDLEDIFD